MGWDFFPREMGSKMAEIPSNNCWVMPRKMVGMYWVLLREGVVDPSLREGPLLLLRGIGVVGTNRNFGKRPKLGGNVLDGTECIEDEVVFTLH